MLFKRKSGKENPNSTRRSWAGKDGIQPSEKGSSAVTNNDEKSSDTDGNVTLNQSSQDGSTNLEETRRAVAQRRATKKLASIDWDIAAREEITALLNGGTKETENQPDADNDLEVVRRAIAKRKSQTNTPGLNHGGLANNTEIGLNENDDLSDQDDHGPRLDWLVDFISEDPAPGINSKTEKEKSSTSSPASNEGQHKHFPSNDLHSGASRNGSGFSDEGKIQENNSHVGGSEQPRGVVNDNERRPSFLPDLTVGDGFGGISIIDADKEPSTENGVERVDSPAKEVIKKRHSPPDTARAPRDRTTPKQPAQRKNANTDGKQKQARVEQASAAPKKKPALDLDSLKTKDRVVGLLLRKQIVSTSQVYEAQKIKERESLKETLWRILVEIDGVDKDAIYEEAARIYAFPIADVEGKLDAKFVRSVLETLSEENRDLLLNLHLVPYECEGEDAGGGVKLAFITHDPMRTEVRRVMKELKLDRFDLYYAPQSAVNSIIAEAFPRKNEYMERLTEDPMAFDLGMSYEDADLIDEDALEAEISRSSLINLFEATLVEAVRQGASDVHIYPNAKKKVEIHFRVDGRLTLWHTEHKVHPEALLAVIKDNAMNVDRFERDAAQDGYIQRWIDDVLIRFRVSVLPIANISHEIRSESIVIRVLDDRKVIRDLRKLGLLDEAMNKFEQAISQPHGMVILTGPTGSGKSTTLVAALHQVITGEVNVLTVEDPVEYIIPGVRQIKLNYKLELENALRAILRHDPDVVMVGEMRDRKTAELAIKLANTGHLTFSTLHTNDAASAISRLYKMGIEPFLIAYAINLVVAQRLIRILCTNCKQPDLDPDPIMLEKLGFTKEEISSNTFYVPGKDNECPVCKGVGYKGRRAVSEAMYFSREIRHMIVEAEKMIDEGGIKNQAVKEGMLTLRDSAREIVKLGQTSVREMIRVVTTEG